jgi:uroporphyrinogen-III decarboxylase
MRDLIARYGDEKWIVGSSQASIFEAAWALRGMSQFMMDMLDNRDYVHRLLDKVMQYPLQACKKFIEMGADMVWVGDDVAGQRRMLMSLELWREYLKPRYAVMFAEFKQANPDIKICYHSDGNCEPILDEMVEIGLDVLNPVQPQATDPFHLKKRYGNNLVLFGGLDVQDTLPFGSPDDVRSAVKKLVEVCGQGGGYILAPSHVMQPDVPLDNILAFYDSGLQ